MNVTLSGFDDFEKHIKKLQENVKKLGGQHNIPFDELFPASFMSNYTDSSSIDELIQKGNFDIKSQEDFEKIPDDKMNSFIAMHTSFLTWNQMFTQASEECAISTKFRQRLSSISWQHLKPTSQLKASTLCIVIQHYVAENLLCQAYRGSESGLSSSVSYLLHILPISLPIYALTANIC